MSSKMQLTKEYPPAGEEEAIDKIVALLKQRLEKDFPPPKRTLRDAHPKQHGLVKAEFTIENNIAKELKVGLFKNPNSYKAWVRLSNLSGGKNIDINKDSRGLAIKLMGVSGEKILENEKDSTTHDFVFMSTDHFVTKDVEGFAKLLNAVNGGKLKAIAFFATHLKLFKLFTGINIQVANLFEIPWGSTTPYLYGDRAVKYALLPQKAKTSTIPQGSPSPNYLRQRMVSDLNNGDVSFDFCIQLQTDAEKMPIEDPRVIWDKGKSPFIKVATLKILKQTFNTEAQQLYGDKLSFSPWHALPEHRPLGGINRGRKVIYSVMSKFRHNRNSEVSNEPTEWKEF